MKQLVEEAKESDQSAREHLIEAYRGEITAAVSSICGRPLDWNNDDELSIGLIAFNEAIDNYDSTKGKNFWNYSRMVIHRRLVDFFRKEARWKYRAAAPLDDEEEFSQHETQQAWDQYYQEETARDQAEMIALYQAALVKFKISLEELVKSSPKHKDTKSNLMQIALNIKANPELLQKVMETKQLPMKELMLLTGNSRKVLEKGRKYIIALLLILTRQEFALMRDFINFPEEGR